MPENDMGSPRYAQLIAHGDSRAVADEAIDLGPGGLKPPITYFGGKIRLAPWIVGHMPEHRVYVEPYFGSGAVFYAKRPSTHEVVNDLDSNVVTFFRVLRERCEDLERVCRLTPFAHDEFDLANLSIDGCDDLDDLERARRFFIRITQGFGKSVGTRSSAGRSVGWSASVLRGSNNARSAQNLIDRFAECAARFRNVTIDNRPALHVIKRFAVEGSVCYLDPPYVSSTRSGLTKRSGDYAFEMTDDDHRELAELVHSLPDVTFLLSGYPSPLYEDLYADWNHADRLMVVPSATSRGAQNRRSIERLWSNRPLRTQSSIDFLEEATHA